MSWDDTVTRTQLWMIRALQRELNYSMLPTDSSLTRKQARDLINDLHRERRRK